MNQRSGRDSKVTTDRDTADQPGLLRLNNYRRSCRPPCLMVSMYRFAIVFIHQAFEVGCICDRVCVNRHDDCAASRFRHRQPGCFVDSVDHYALRTVRSLYLLSQFGRQGFNCDATGS